MENDSERKNDESPKQAHSSLRIAAAVFIILAFLVVCQNLQERLTGGRSISVALAVLGFGSLLFYIIRRSAARSLLSSVKLVVVLLIYFALACIGSTLVLQQPGTFPADESHETARFGSFASAEAPFVYRLTHPFRRFPTELSPVYKNYTEMIEAKFGAAYAKEKRKEFVQSARHAEEEKAIRDFAERHAAFFQFLYRLVEFTHLDRAYSAWWFRAISVMVFINTVFCIGARFRLRLAQTGFLLTHVGLVIALVGAGIGSRYEQKGMMQFLAGVDGQDRLTSFLDAYTQKEVDLGFAVRAKYFRTEYHSKLDVTFLDTGMEESPHPIHASRSFERLRKGQTLTLDDGKLTITVEDIIPHAIYDDKLYSRSDEPENPAIEILIRNEKGPDFLRLYAHNPSENRFIDVRRRLQIKFAWFADQAGLQPGIAEFSGESPAIFMALGQDGTVTIRPVHKGETFQHGSYTVEVLDCQGDYEHSSPAPPRDQQAANPAVHIKTTSPNGKSRERWVFSTKPVHEKETGLVMALLWESEDFGRYLIYGIGNGSPNLIKIVGKKAVGPTPLAKGQPIDAGGPAASIFLAGFALDAALRGVAPYSPPAGADAIQRTFEDPSRQAIKLRINGPGFQDSVTLLANSPEARKCELPGYVSLDYGNGAVKDYKAYLIVEDKDDPSVQKKAQIVEVNQPLSYGGFTFYQEKFDAKVQNYTGIKVKRDPGSTPAQIGLVIMLIGIAFVFYVKPMFAKAK